MHKKENITPAESRACSSAKADLEYVIIKLPSSVSKRSLIHVENTLSSQIKHGSIDYLLDVEGISLSPSIMLGLIVYLFKKVVKAKGNLFLINADAEMAETLRMTNIEKMIPVFSSLENYKEKNWITDDSSQDFTAHIRQGKTCVVVEFSGILTGRSTHLVKTFDALKGATPCYLFDFGKAKMLDSMAVGILLEFYKRIKSKNGQVVFVQTNNDVAELFKTIELDKIIPVFATMEEGHNFLKRENR